MNFFDIDQYIKQYLMSVGYKAHVTGVYTLKRDSGVFQWVSITGNSYIVNVTLGVVCIEVNRIAAKIMHDIDGFSMPVGRLGPPLAIASLPKCIEIFGDDDLLARVMPGAGGVDINNIETICYAIENIGSQFFELNSNIQSIAKFALSNGSVSPAQRYLLPVAASMTNNIETFDDMVKMITETVPAQEGNFFKQYFDIVRSRM